MTSIELNDTINITNTPEIKEIQGTYSERIQELKDKMLPQEETKQTVVILGAGPAGIRRAITSIMNGNPTHIIEKRSENCPGRINTVRLEGETIQDLREIGVYQYLLEHKLIFPALKDGDYSTTMEVRLGDLEEALKAVLKELRPEQEICYSSTLSEINRDNPLLSLTVESTDKQRKIIENVGILLNAEGSRSSTNALLGIDRVSVLPNKPAIAAIFQDRRPRINSFRTFFQYIGISIAYVAKTVYYHTLFIFKYIFCRSFRRECLGVILRTPGQVYMGCGFSSEVDSRIMKLKSDIALKTEALSKATTKKEKQKCEKAVKSAKNRYESFLKMRANLGLCAVNFINLFTRPKGEKVTSKHLSYVSCHAIEIGADHASQFAIKNRKSAILLAGDAAATVDPSTGLGCNTALQSNAEFATFLEKTNYVGIKENIEAYAESIQKRVEFIHNESKDFRRFFSALISK
jgi:2-polyprenyl-6-methoxyphenol hydroxylase-like FAD-dependent oxidoreductase